MKKVMTLLVFACLVLSTGVASADDNATYAAIDALSATYDSDVAALTTQYEEGEITAEEFKDGVIAANTQLVDDLAPLKAQLSS